MTIGKSLQSKRLEKKLSLTDVSHSLKIDEKTLQQIEADNFTGLNPVVVRSYIRQYASLLGLDGAKLLDAYTKSAAQAEAPATQQAAPVPAPAPKKKTEAEIKLAKTQKAVSNSRSVRGLKSIFNLFDKINLDKFLKYGIWVIMGLAVVGSVAKGFTTAASKISTNQSSSVSSSSSQDKKQPPKKDDQPSSPAPDDQSSQSSAQSSSSQADEASSSASSSAQKESSASSAAQSSSSSASSQAAEANSSSENTTE